MTSYKSYKNLLSRFESFPQTNNKNYLNLDGLNAFAKSDLIIAYYKDDSVVMDGDMFCDAMANPKFRAALLGLMDFSISDANTIIMQKNELVALAWHEIGTFIQGLWNEFHANYEQDYVLDSIGDDGCATHSPYSRAAMGGV